MVPALLVQLALFGTAFVGFGLIAEYRSRVIERMRVTPVSRIALLLGRSLRDVVVLTVSPAFYCRCRWRLLGCSPCRDSIPSSTWWTPPARHS